MESSEYIQARKSQLNFYKDIRLYTKVEGKGFVLYKKAGITLNDMRVDQARYPKVLYIKQADKLKGIQEAQKGFNKQLENDVKSKKSCQS